MINGQQLVDLGIITGHIEKENIQQIGVDLNLIEVRKIEGEGVIPFTGATVLAQRRLIEPNYHLDGSNKRLSFWALEPGAYDITFSQGCVIPADHYCLIRQRSSLLRNGAILHSSVFDPGYRTGRISAVVNLTNPLVIEYNARVAQMYAHPCNTVKNLYAGQWQNENPIAVDNNDSITNTKYVVNG